MNIAREAALEAVRAVFSQGFAPEHGRDQANLENTNTSHDEMDVRTSKGVSTDMASPFRERVYLGLDEDGNEIVKWASGSSRTELHDSIVRLYVKYGKIDRFLAEMRHPLAYESEKKVVLFKDYYEQVWLPLKEKQVKKTTLAGYKNYFGKHLLPEFGDSNLFEIRPFDVQAYFDAKSELSRKTLREHYNVLCAFFDYAIDDERVLLPRNPARSKHVVVRYSEKDSKVRQALPSEVIREIIDGIATLPLTQRRLMSLLLFTGTRRGEVLALRWEDIDFEGKRIVVRRNATYADNQAEVTSPKTENGYRTLPLYEQLSALLLPHKKGGYIVGGMQKPISMTVYRTMFNHVRKAIDLHDATAHVFRHSYLTMLDEAGVDPKTLQYIAGHGNFSFTMNRYVHGRERAAMQAGVKFEGLLNQAEQIQPFVQAGA